MFCKYCGAVIDDDSTFCKSCGKKISPIPASDNATNDPEDFNSAQQGNDEQFSEDNSKNRKSKKWLLIIVLIILLIFIVFLAVPSSNSSDNLSYSAYHDANFNNGAGFAFDDTNLYFVGHYNSTDEYQSLYSTDYYGSNKTQLSQKTIYNIRINDGTIYYEYYNSDDKCWIVGSMATDGSEDQELVSSGVMLYSFDIDGDYLYYKTTKGLYRCALDGSNAEGLVSGVEDYIVENNIVWCVSEDAVYAYYPDEGSSALICEVDGAENLTLDGSTLYFSAEDGIYSFSINDTTNVTQVISSDRVDSYVFYDDRIYYEHHSVFYEASVKTGLSVEISAYTGIDYFEEIYSYPSGIYNCSGSSSYEWEFVDVP